MIVQKDMVSRLKSQGWEYCPILEKDWIAWYKNSKYPGCFIRLDTEGHWLDRFTGVKVITDIKLLPGTPALF